MSANCAAATVFGVGASCEPCCAGATVGIVAMMHRMSTRTCRMPVKVQIPDRCYIRRRSAFAKATDRRSAMRNALRLVWVIGMLAVLGFLLHEKGAAQSELQPPVPPNLFT